MPTRQIINIGIQSNDGTGDSIRDAFRKTNENFAELYSLLNSPDGLRFTGLADYPSGAPAFRGPLNPFGLGLGKELISTDTSGTTLTRVTLVGDGVGISVDYDNAYSKLVISATTSSLAKDPNPTLSNNLTGTGTGTKTIVVGTDTVSTVTGVFSWRAKDFADPIASQDLVTRQFLYDNFLSRNGTYITGTETNTSTVFGGSTLTSNISLIPAATTAVNTASIFGKFITVFDSSGTTSTVDLVLQATSSSHITRKDYVDTKISLQGTETIDPATGEVNQGFGMMTGPLILSRDPVTEDDFLWDGKIAATKRYVDNNDFFSQNNLFITTKGRDYQPDVPPIRRGRATQYAFRSINKAAQYAEKLIATARIQVGDYARNITYSNGIPAIVVDTTPNFFGQGLNRLRLDVGNLGSDQFGVADVGKYTIFPGQYMQGVDSGAIALIENIQKASNNGDPEVYSIAYVDYGDDFDTPIISSLPDPSNPNKIKFTFDDEPQQIVPIPDFWVGYYFYTDTGIPNGIITEVGAEVNNVGIYHNYFIVEFESGAPGAGLTFAADVWHVYAGDFQPGEEVVYNTNVGALQITLVIESGEYLEQYPIKLPANTSVRGDEFRRCIIRPAQGISSSKWANTYFRRDAQTDGLQTSALNTATDYTSSATMINASAIPSGSSGVVSFSLSTGTMDLSVKGFMFVSDFGGQGIIDDVTSGGFTVNLGIPLLNAQPIPYGSWHIYKPILFGYHYLRDPQRPQNILFSRNNVGGYEKSAELLEKNKTFMQLEVTKWMNAQIDLNSSNTSSYWFGFTYNNTSSIRDTGTLVDGIVYDLIFGGSEKTINNADRISQVPSLTTGACGAGIQYLNTLTQLILNNQPITPSVGNTATQYINTFTVAEPASLLIVQDLIDAAVRIVNLDPAYNPPKENRELDVFLMNDANVIRYVSCQNHGGFMQVLDPVGQIKNKSPYTQTASSFSQSYNKQVFSGGMLVDGFTGNVLCTPDNWDPINSPLALDVDGLIRRPQVPTFFNVRGVRYEVSFFANFRPTGTLPTGETTYSATLRLNPLSPGGISNNVIVVDNAAIPQFMPNQTNIPIIVEQPTGIGGLGARGRAITDSSGFITDIVIDFPGTGYASTPYINVGGAIFNNLEIIDGGVYGASIVSGGFYYKVGTTIDIIPVGIIGGVKASGTVTAVDVNGTITAIAITTPGANWNPSVNFRVAFGDLDIQVPTPAAGYLDSAPAEIELITAGNRSMLANDFTQVNDLGYGIFVTNGGFMENVSMFTYYAYRSYYALNGSQVRTLTGSSVYGEWGLVADGRDPNEVPLALANVFPLVQVANAYVVNPLFPAQKGQTYIFVTVDNANGGYPPLNGSVIEINHGGIRKNYVIGTASPALDSNNEQILNTYQLFFATGNIATGTEGAGLFETVNSGDPIIIRASTLVKVIGFNPVSIARPSTSLTWNDDPTYVYNITGFSNVQPDGSVFAFTQQDYNYITFQAVEQGIVHPQLISGGSGYTSTGTSVFIDTSGLILNASSTVDGDQGAGTIGIQTIKMTNVNNIRVGHLVSTGTYILTDTYVTYVDPATGRIAISNPTAGPILDGTVLNFSATLPIATVSISSGTITNIVVDEGGRGWNTSVANIVINGDGVGALVQTPITIAGTVGSDIVKITTLDLTSQNRILSGLIQNPPRYYQFAHGDQIYKIVGYRTPSSRGAVFEVSITTGTYTAIAITEPGTGYSVNQQLTILGTQVGGATPTNDINIVVTQVTGNGALSAISFTGTATTGLTANFTDVSPPDDGQISAEIDISPPLVEPISKGTILRAGIPVNSPGQLTTKISILRATGHDFVDIGTGGYASTRIPNDLYGPPIQTRKPSNEVIQVNRGRVYWVSSDQDGNVRIGDALVVNQAQGSVTISVPLDLSNLSSLSLRRDLGPPVNEFSIDSTMISEADFKVPTEQAVANYINRRLGIDRNGNIYAGSPLGPQFMSLDGQLPMKADLSMGFTNRIVNMQTPIDSTDAATKGFVDTKISNAGTSAVDTNGVTLKPEWGRMTGSLQLFNDPEVKTAVVATTATIGATQITFTNLSVPGSYQAGDFYEHRVIVAGVPTGTIVNAVFQDEVTLGLGNPVNDQNVPITQTIPAGTVVTFDPINQAATKRYVDRQTQFRKLSDVRLSGEADRDFVMFGSTVFAVNSTTNPPVYEPAREVLNVANDTSVITNTPNTSGGGSDITVNRSGNIVTFKLVGGAGSNNPVTDYHVNDDAEIQQSKLLMNTATTRTLPATGNARQIQATLGLANFDSRMFTATSGWVTLVDSTGTTSGVQPSKQSWVPIGGGLLGATNTLANTAATYVTSASVQTWLQNLSSDWRYSSNLTPNIDIAEDLGVTARRWGNIFASTATLDGGLIVNTLARINTNQTSADIFTTTVTTLNVGNLATTARIGATSGTLTLGNPNVVGTQATQNLYTLTATTLNIGLAATTMRIGAGSGTLTIGNSDVVGVSASQNLYNTVATTLNVGSAATTMRIGATSGTLTIGNPTVVGTQATQAVFNTVATTVNAFGAATSLNLGAGSGTTTVNNNLAARNITDNGSRVITTATITAGTGITGGGTITGPNGTVTITNNGVVGLTVSGTGLSVSGSAGGTFNVASNATNGNTGGTIVARDGSGNFSAGTITANLTGRATDSAKISGNGAVITAGSAGTSFSNSVQVREPAEGGALTDTPANYPRLGFHWSGRVASSIALLGDGTFGFYDNPGTGFQSIRVNEMFGTASSARFADLAEKYLADAEYEPGTVLEFGGEQEVTLANEDSTTRVAGVVSTNPAYLMNSELGGDNVVTVALTGRVPCKVKGKVRKGDLMVVAGNGFARAEAKPGVGTVIGKALENFDGDEGVIEVVVGRF